MDSNKRLFKLRPFKDWNLKKLLDLQDYVMSKLFEAIDNTWNKTVEFRLRKLEQSLNFEIKLKKYKEQIKETFNFSKNKNGS